MPFRNPSFERAKHSDGVTGQRELPLLPSSPRCSAQPALLTRAHIPLPRSPLCPGGHSADSGEGPPPWADGPLHRLSALHHWWVAVAAALHELTTNLHGNAGRSSCSAALEPRFAMGSRWVANRPPRPHPDFTPHLRPCLASLPLPLSLQACACCPSSSTASSC